MTNTDLVNLQRITEKQNKVGIADRMWARLLSSTNQPSFLTAKDVNEEEMTNHTNELNNKTEDETVSNVVQTELCQEFER